MASSEAISPFTISVSEQALLDLQERLELARFPQSLELSASTEWDCGAPTKRVEDLVRYWKQSFDWRKIEADINAKLPQFTTSIDAEAPHGILKVHFVHIRSQKPNAIPLLFSHGWPGNFLEPLTNPSDPKDPAFHVVAPSLPGFVFSEPSKSPGLGAKSTALIFNKLMDRLGYKQYIAQGGDWGALILKTLAVYHAKSCRGTHSNMAFVPPPSFFRNPIRMSRVILGYIGLPGGYSKREIQYLKDAQHNEAHEMGYLGIQATKPQTLAFGLTDSPVGLLAWIYEKLHKWTDAYPWSNDEILTWVILYWVSVAGPAGSVRYYKEVGIQTGEGATIVRARSNISLGVSVFKGELFKVPDDWCNMVQPAVYHKYHEEGGHFAAYEKPDLLVEDIRRFTDIVLKTEKTLRPS